MKGKRYTQEQIIGILKAHEAGAKVADLIRKHCGISEQSFYRWKSKYGGMEVSEAKRQKRKLPPIDRQMKSRAFWQNCSQEVQMKKTRFTEAQIVSILKSGEAGLKVKDICREHGISEATFYNWKSKYGGMEVSDLRRMKELEAENAKLKRMYTDLALEHRAMKDLIEKKL